MSEARNLPRGVKAIALQPYGEDREALVAEARAHGYGLEIADFAFPAVLDDAARCGELLSWYREQLSALPPPHALHGPFFDLHPSSIDPKVAALARGRISHCLDIAEALEVQCVILHSDFNPGIRSPEYPAKWVERQARFWAEVLRGRALAITLENLWDESPATLRDALDAIGMESVGICLDAGHAHLHSAAPLTEWVDVLGARIRHLHLSDNNRGWDQHLALGQGTVGWTSFFAALDVAGVDVPATLEVDAAGVQTAVAYLQQLASTRVGGKR